MPPPPALFPQRDPVKAASPPEVIYTPAIPISSGSRIGPYEVLSALGAGGMGEVYRARDGKLNRDVALKVLPDSFANDPERLARFQREAQVLASLNHPNIAHIHGIEDAQGVRALVMELVEGPTLADRIAQGAIPLVEALPIAKQIADALEAAHAQGIIHRDLKPANIKVRADGTVKVLDFGLAKALVPEGASATANAMNSPTITSPAMMTGAGIILGTAAYMSPEQAKGKAVDKRTDIWAFGCVLFEMLTGKRAFDGEDVTDTLAFIITRDPDWAALPANTPASMRRLLRRCLEKDRRRRLADIADARLEIEEGLLAPVTQASSPISAARGRLPWVFATTVLAVAVLLLGFAYIRQAPLPPPTTRFQVPLPEKTTAPMFRVSPDGRMLAISASEGGRSRLWIRSLDALNATPLAGTDDATYPFWSPDSADIGFFAQGKLKKIAVSGGPPQTLCSALGGRGGTWSESGVIVFSDLASGLSRVAAAGGVPTAVTTKSANTAEVHRFPEFLPGGTRFLFSIDSAALDVNGIYAGSLDGAPPVRILSDKSNAVYVPPAASGASSHLLFRRDGTLMAQPFDPERIAMIGETFPLAEHVGISVNTQNGAFSASHNGVLVYGEGNVETQMRELVWIDRTGRRVGSLGPPVPLIAAALSPDEKTISLSVSAAAGSASDVWLHEVGRNLRSRLTFRPGLNYDAIWSPDGSRIVFGSESSSVYQKPANGTGSEELLLRFGINLRLLDWSPDGKFVVFQAQTGEAGTGLFFLPLQGDRTPVPYLQTPFNEADAQFSPDGRWMAYASNESGEPQVYVQAIPASGRKWQISTAGGSQPRWRQDGEELFYLSGDQKLMAVSVKTGAAFETGSPQPLFDIAPVYPALFGLFAYQPAAAGQRFLVTMPVAGAATPALTVVLNWQAGLSK